MLFRFLGAGYPPILGILLFLFIFTVLVFCITVHEFAHAWAAFKLGDPTAKNLGRVTLNPLAHLDGLGTLMLVLFGFGWGKPVSFDPSNFSNPRLYSALVSLAGPASNFLFACFFALVYRVSPPIAISGVFQVLVVLNLTLCFFNLIPVNPLDGFKVVWGFLPKQLAWQWMDLAPYGVYLLLFLLFTNTAGVLISAPVEFFTRILLG